MKPLALALVAALLLACSSDSGGDPLLGQWSFDSSSTQCTVGLDLTADMTYSLLNVCVLTDGSYGASIEAGSYDVIDKMITLTPSKSSCADFAPSSATYTVDSKQLVLIGSTATLELQRTKNDSSGSGAVTHGCFAADGTFTPMPIASKP